MVGVLSISFGIVLRWTPRDYIDDKLQVNIASGKDLVSSGNKPSSELMLTKTYTAYGVTTPKWFKRSV